MVVGDRGLEPAHMEDDSVGTGPLELGLVHDVTGEEPTEETHGPILEEQKGEGPSLV
jgi:hypothetical protein